MRPTDRLMRAAPLAVPLGLAVVLLWPVLFGGRVLVPADTLLVMTPWKQLARERFPEFREAQNGLLDPVQQYYPWRDYATDSLRRNVVPLWNPYMLCGTPFVANQQSAVFYPPNVLFLLTGTARGFGWSALLHLSLLGWGTFLFLSQLGLRREAALAGAVAFMFNGYTVAWLEFPAFGLWVAAWLPWTLFLFERARSTRSLRAALLCGLVVGLQFCGGQLQVSFYLLFALVTFGLFRILGDRTRPWPGEVARWLALPLALGGLLAALHLGPSLEIVPYSGRAEANSLAAVRAMAMPWWQIATYVVPDLYGNPAFHGLYWGHFNYIEMCGYVGVTTLVFALWILGCAPPTRRAMVLYFALLAAVGLAIATVTPLYLLPYYLVPGFKALGGPARIVLLTAFALASLAALAVDHLIGGEPDHRRGRAALYVVPAALLTLVVLALVREAERFTGPEQPNFFNATPIVGGDTMFAYGLRQLARAFLLGAVAVTLLAWRNRSARRLERRRFALAVVGLVAIDMLSFAHGFNPMVLPEMVFFPTPVTDYLRAHAGLARITSTARLPEESAAQGRPHRAFLDWMAPNTPMAYRLYDMRGSDSLRVGHYIALLSAFGTDVGQPDWPELDAPLLDLLGVRYVLTPRASMEPRFRLVFADHGVQVYENLGALPRAFSLSAWRVAPDSRTALAILSAPGYNPREAVLLTDSGWPDRPGPGRLEPWSLTYPSPNRAVATGHPTSDGLLVLSDVWYPGWRATVDGREAPTWRAYHSLRAVPVSAGRHEVRFVYAPASFKVGLFLTLLALSATTILWLAARGSRP